MEFTFQWEERGSKHVIAHIHVHIYSYIFVLARTHYVYIYIYTDIYVHCIYLTKVKVLTGLVADSIIVAHFTLVIF